MADTSLGQLSFDFKIPWSEINKSLAMVQTSIRKISTRISSNMSSSFSSILSIGKKVSLGLINVFKNAFSRILSIVKNSMLAAGAAIAGYLTFSSKMAMDTSELEALFSQVFKGMSNSVESWADAYSRSLKLNIYDTKNAITYSYLLAKNIGQTEEQALGTAKAVTMLANDLKAAYNLKGNQAFEKLMSGLSGESEPLKRIGIIVNETTVKNYAMANGYKFLNGQLSESQKVQARLGVIMESTSEVRGQMARELGEVSQQLRAIKDSFIYQMIAMGKTIITSKIFIASLQKISENLPKLQQGFSNLVEKGLNKISELMDDPKFVEKFNSVVKSLRDTVVNLYQIVGNLAKRFNNFLQDPEKMAKLKEDLLMVKSALMSISKMIINWSKVFGIFLNTAVKIFEGLGGGIIGSVTALGFVVTILAVIKQVSFRLWNLFTKIADVFVSWMAGAYKTKEALKQIYKLISPFFKFVSAMLSSIKSVIVNITGHTINALYKIINFGPKLIGIFGSTFKWVAKIGKGLLGIVGQMWLAWDIGWYIGKAFLYIYEKILDAFGILQKFKDTIDNIMQKSGIVYIVGKVSGIGQSDETKAAMARNEERLAAIKQNGPILSSGDKSLTQGEKEIVSELKNLSENIKNQPYQMGRIANTYS